MGNQECPNIKINNKKIMLDVKAKYLGLIMDRRLNWSTHIKGMVDKAKKRCFQLKAMCSKFNYHQSIVINMYKSLIRPILEYGSEIWGDTCKTNKKKLEVIEQRALSIALGVSKLAKRSEINIEAGILPLKLRITRKNILTYKRKLASPLSEYIKNAKNKCIGRGVRSSFIERAEKTLTDMDIRREFLNNIKTEFIDNHIKKEWREKIKFERSKSKIYYAKDVELKYKFFSESRTIMKVWHQARLKVIPTADHLYKIKCSEERFCKFDCSIETNDHF